MYFIKKLIFFFHFSFLLEGKKGARNFFGDNIKLKVPAGKKQELFKSFFLIHAIQSPV